jgi:hypothetical protein
VSLLTTIALHAGAAHRDLAWVGQKETRGRVVLKKLQVIYY